MRVLLRSAYKLGCRTKCQLHVKIEVQCIIMMELRSLQRSGKKICLKVIFLGSNKNRLRETKVAPLMFQNELEIPRKCLSTNLISFLQLLSNPSKKIPCAHALLTQWDKIQNLIQTFWSQWIFGSKLDSWFKINFDSKEI